VWSSSEPRRVATAILRLTLSLLAGVFVVAMIYGPTLLQKRWHTPLTVFPLPFVLIILSLAILLMYAAIRSRLRLALGTVSVLALLFVVGLVGFILPAMDAAASTRQASDAIKSFPRSSSDTLYLYSPRWPGNEDIVYYLNLEPALPRISSEDMLLERLRRTDHVLAVMDNTSLASLKTRPDVSFELVHEFSQPRSKNMHMLNIKRADHSDSLQPR
jgi:hypothetical protein